MTDNLIVIIICCPVWVDMKATFKILILKEQETVEIMIYDQKSQGSLLFQSAIFSKEQYVEKIIKKDSISLR